MSLQAGAPQPEGVAGGSPLAGLGAKLGAADVRPTATMQNAIVAAGGVLAAMGLINIGKDSRGALIALALLVVALGAGTFLVSGLKSVIPAGMAMIVVGLLQFVGSATIDSDGGSDVNSIAGWAILTVVGLALFAAPFTRGKPVFLGGALIALWAFAVALYVDAFGIMVFFAGSPAGVGSVGSLDVEKGAYISLVVALAYLALLWYLDMLGERGLAGPVAVAAIVALTAGAIGAAGSDNFGRGFLALLAGAAATYVGGLHGRRATTWAGGVAIVAGVYTIVDSFFDPSGAFTAPIGRGGGFLLFFLGLVVIGAGAFKSLAADGVLDQIKAKQASLASQAAGAAATESPDYTRPVDTVEPSGVAAPDGGAGDGAAAAAGDGSGWHADPAGRNELRWYDGTQWTEHVSNAGERSVDPPV